MSRYWPINRLLGELVWKGGDAAKEKLMRINKCKQCWSWKKRGLFIPRLDGWPNM